MEKQNANPIVLSGGGAERRVTRDREQDTEHQTDVHGDSGEVFSFGLEGRVGRTLTLEGFAGANVRAGGPIEDQDVAQQAQSITADEGFGLIRDINGTSSMAMLWVAQMDVKERAVPSARSLQRQV